MDHLQALDIAGELELSTVGLPEGCITLQRPRPHPRKEMSPFLVACPGAKTNGHLPPGMSSWDSCSMDQVMIQPGTPFWTSQVAPAPQIPTGVLPATHPMLMESRGVTSVRSGYWYKIPLLPFGKMREGVTGVSPALISPAFGPTANPALPSTPTALWGHIPAAGHPQTVALATKPVA